MRRWRAGLVLPWLVLAACGGGKSGSNLELTVQASWPPASNAGGQVDTLMVEVRDLAGELVGGPALVAIPPGLVSARLNVESTPGKGRSVHLMALGLRVPLGVDESGLSGRGILYYERVDGVEVVADAPPTVNRALRPFVPRLQAPHFELDGQTHRVSWSRVTGAGYLLRRWVAGGAPVDSALADTFWVGSTLPARYQVRAVESPEIAGAASDAASYVTPLPDVPVNLRATVRSGERIDLRWTSPSLFNGFFELQRRDAGQDYAPLVTLGSDTTSFRDSTTVDGRPWGYRVRSRNGFGPSTWSPAIEARTPLNVPGELTAVPDSAAGEVALTWLERSQSENGYEVERRDPGTPEFVSRVTLPLNAAGWVDRAVSENSTYVYRARALGDPDHSNWSNEAQATTPLLVPSTPAGLTADRVDTTFVDLRWGSARGTVAAYEVERRRLPDEPFGRVVSLGSEVLIWRDPDLEGGQSYEYRVRAVNATGPGGWSNVVPVTTPGPAS